MCLLGALKGDCCCVLAQAKYRWCLWWSERLRVRERVVQAVRAKGGLLCRDPCMHRVCTASFILRSAGFS